MATVHDEAIPVTLADIMREVMAIRTLLETSGCRPLLSREDRDQLGKIVAGDRGYLGDRKPCASRDLGHGCRRPCHVRGLSIKQVSKLLSRGVGIPINGLVIERAGHEVSVCLWRVGAC